MDRLPIKGFVSLDIERGGSIIYSCKGSNTVVTAGKNLCTAILQTSGAPSRPTHFGFGSGGNATDLSNTALQTEFTTGTLPGYARHAFSTSYASNTITYATSGGWTVGGAATLREIGIFNASTAGTMLARFLVSVFSLQTGDSIGLTWTLVVG